MIKTATIESRKAVPCTKALDSYNPIFSDRRVLNTPWMLIAAPAIILNRKPIKNVSRPFPSGTKAVLCRCSSILNRIGACLKGCCENKNKLALNLEGLTVCALVHRRVCLVRTYVDFVQRAIIFLPAVEFALRYAAANCMVCFTCHHHSPPYEISITSGYMFYSQ